MSARPKNSVEGFAIPSPSWNYCGRRRIQNKENWLVKLLYAILVIANSCCVFKSHTRLHCGRMALTTAKDSSSILPDVNVDLECSLSI